MSNFPHEAMAVIYDILQVGSKKHKPGDWRKESMEHHTNKAYHHLTECWLEGKEMNFDTEDTLAHALTRLAMAVAVRSQYNVNNL